MSTTTAEPAPARTGAWRRHRTTLVIVGAAVAAVAVALLVGGRPATSEALDPDNPGADGARAVARVLDGQGVDVEVGEREAAVDLTVIIDYGESIPEISEQIRDNVIQRIEGITGLRVTEVNVAVNDLYFPGDEQPEQPARVS